MLSVRKSPLPPGGVGSGSLANSYWLIREPYTDLRRHFSSHSGRQPHKAKMTISSNSCQVEMALCNHGDTQYNLVCLGKEKTPSTTTSTVWYHPEFWRVSFRPGSWHREVSPLTKMPNNLSQLSRTLNGFLDELLINPTS